MRCFGGGGQVGADGAECPGTVHGPHAAGDLDPQLAHPDLAFGGVVVEQDAGVGGEPEVVILALAEPAGEGVVLSRQRPGAGGGLLLADQDGGAEPVPGDGESITI